MYECQEPLSVARTPTWPRFKSDDFCCSSTFPPFFAVSLLGEPDSLASVEDCAGYSCSVAGYLGVLFLVKDGELKKVPTNDAARHFAITNGNPEEVGHQT